MFVFTCFYLLSRGFSWYSAITHPIVWPMPLFVLGGIGSAYFEGAGSQWLQVGLFLVIAVMNALTSRYDDLTGSLYMALGLALAATYDILSGYLWTVFVPVGVAFLVGRVIAIISHYPFPQFWLPLSLMIFVHTMLIVILSGLLRHVSQSHQAQRRTLEKQVSLRTRELNDELTRSTVLLQRNETLLREVHHRTRNNLQIIGSLLALQANRPAQQQESAEAALRRTAERIQVITWAHELFHDSTTSPNDGLRVLVLEIIAGTRYARSSVGLNVDMDDLGSFDATMDVAVPLGLIIHELILNACDHAFPHGTYGLVWLKLQDVQGELKVEVWDNGTGIPDSISVQEPVTTGLQIVMALVHQLRGAIRLDGDPRSHWTITVPRMSQQLSRV